MRLVSNDEAQMSREDVANHRHERSRSTWLTRDEYTDETNMHHNTDTHTHTRLTSPTYPSIIPETLTQVTTAPALSERNRLEILGE